MFNYQVTKKHRFIKTKDWDGFSLKLLKIIRKIFTRINKGKDHCNTTYIEIFLFLLRD